MKPKPKPWDRSSFDKLPKVKGAKPKAMKVPKVKKGGSKAKSYC